VDVCVKVAMKRLSLAKNDAHNLVKCNSLTSSRIRLTVPQCGNESVILYGLRYWDVKL